VNRCSFGSTSLRCEPLPRAAGRDSQLRSGICEAAVPWNPRGAKAAPLAMRAGLILIQIADQYPTAYQFSSNAPAINFCCLAGSSVDNRLPQN
jgi:hypothetical protein